MRFSFAIFLILSLTIFLSSEEKLYQVTSSYETDNSGRVLRQQEFSGWLKLLDNGTYQFQVHIYDDGTYKLIKAGPNNPKDMIYFTSNKGFQFFSYPGTNGQSQDIWLYRTNTGTNVWVKAIKSKSATKPAETSPSKTQTADKNAQGGGTLSISNGRFTAVVLYGTTSAPSYYRYDAATGRFSDDQKGIIFHPNGTYYLKADFGDLTTEEQGRYMISGNQVALQFSDGSALTLTIMENGRKLHWYSSGMLIGEFFFLGTAK
jgi:hypothetical protein